MLPPLCDANVHMMSIELNAAPTQRLFVSRYILRVIYAVTGIRSIKLAVFHHGKVSVPSKCVFSNTIQEIPNGYPRADRIDENRDKVKVEL